MKKLCMHCVLFSALLLLPSTAVVAERATSSPGAETGADSPKPKPVCRTMLAPGTRLAAKHESASAEEWARMKEEHGRDLQRQPSLSLCGQGCTFR